MITHLQGLKFLRLKLQFFQDEYFIFFSYMVEKKKMMTWEQHEFPYGENSNRIFTVVLMDTIATFLMAKIQIGFLQLYILYMKEDRDKSISTYMSYCIGPSLIHIVREQNAS